MIFRCAIDIFCGGMKKSLLSIILLAGGIYLCFFLALSYCSQSYVFDSVDEALGGKADSFGIIQIDGLDENTPALIRYLAESDGLMNATRASEEPGMTSEPQLKNTSAAFKKSVDHLPSAPVAVL